MATVIAPNSQIVRVPGVGFDSTGAPAPGAGMTMGKFDMTSYATSGGIVKASDLGLSEIWTLSVESAEAVSNRHYTITCTVADGGKTANVILYDADATAAEVTDAEDSGVWSFVASGILGGQGANS